MHELLLELSRAGGALAHLWAPISLFTLALLGGAAVLDALFRSRVRASWRLLFYVPVLARAVLPPGWTTPLGVLREHTALPAAGIAGNAHFQLLGAAPPASPTGWKVAVASIWLAGAIALLLLWSISQLRLMRALRGARPTRPEWARLSGKHVVLEHDSLGPMVVGLLSPRIVLPASLPGDPTCIIRHELAHLERRDPWSAAILQLVQALLWPVVPVLLAVWRMRQLMELACDERALVGADDVERQRYGKTLLAMAELHRVTVRPRPVFELHFGAALRARLRALRSRRRWPAPLQGALAVAAAGMILACGGTRPAPVPEKTAEKTAPLYTGRHIDLDFKDANLLNILRLMGDVGQVKIWVDDTISQNPPKVTLVYRDVPWDQVLDELAQKNGLQIRRVGDTYYLSRRSVPAARLYTGKPVTLEFNEADIRKVMQLLADVGQVKIEVADDVHVNITMNLREMPWDQALDTIVWTKGLSVQKSGDVIRIVRTAQP